MFLLLWLLPLATASCSGGRSWEDYGPSDLQGSRPIAFDVGGSRVEGRLFGDGNKGVVLVHGFGVDQRAWFTFAHTLAGEGYTVLTFDSRGYCPGGQGGCSEGSQGIDNRWEEVVSAVEFLRELPVSSVSLVGSSLGGTASLEAAATLKTEPVAAVITLSSPTLTISRAVLQEISGGKLFVAGAGDATAPASARQFYDWSDTPRRIAIVDSDSHGASLLWSDRAAEVRRLLLEHLSEYASAKPK
jgi:pimeloyl-ACP methyl ester carboxylesterase